jgi:hypothetical protein
MASGLISHRMCAVWSEVFIHLGDSRDVAGISWNVAFSVRDVASATLIRESGGETRCNAVVGFRV